MTGRTCLLFWIYFCISHWIIGQNNQVMVYADLVLQFSPQNVFENDTLTITCSYDGTNSLNYMQWLFDDGKPLSYAFNRSCIKVLGSDIDPGNEITCRSDFKIFTWKIKSVSMQHQNVKVRCLSENTLSSPELRINIQGLVLAETILSPSTAVVSENTSVILTCTYTGDGTVIFFTWQLSKTFESTYNNIGIITAECKTFIINVDASLYNYTCPNNKQYTWTIRKVKRQNDGDLYRCYADTASSESMRSNEVTLSVQVPITSVTMVKPSNSPLTVKENTEVEFKCKTSGGLPTASITWYKDSSTSVDSSDDLEITSGIESTSTATNSLLEVTSILRYSPSRNENGWSIYCTASNVAGQTPVVSGSKPLLYVRYPPGSPVITGYTNGDEYHVVENTQGRLSCTVTGGNPAPVLTWSCINSGVLGISSNGIVTKTQTWIAQQNQDRTCTCKSSHYSGERTVSIKIEVLYPPTKPTFRLKLTPVSGTVKVIRNNNFSVGCLSLGNPPPSYTWTYPDMTTTSNGQELSVSNLQNNGKYTCNVQNSMVPSDGAAVPGSNTSFITVLVLYPPIIGNLKNKSVAEGSQVTVSCPVTLGYPSQTAYEWLRNGTVWKRTQTFAIDTTSRNDAMIYTCTASNRMQETGEQPVSQPYTKSFYLDVFYEASITSFFIEGHRGQTHVTVDENDGGIQFTCEVDSNPSSTVNILFNGVVKKERSNTNQISMILSNAACLDGGEYTCEGYNQYGQLSMKGIRLFVNCSPRPLHQIRQHINSVLHVPVTLSFTALAYPHPGTKGFAWFKENDGNWYPVLSNADLQISSSASQSNLTLSNVSIADFGRYRVTVTNEIGSFVQYLFLEEDLAENEGLSENCQRFTERAENSALITGISLGVVVAVLAVYATSITILYKRNIGSKDKQVVVKESTQKTYVNIAYKPNLPENKNKDGTPEAEGDEARQYTDLVGYSRDDRTTYEVLQGL